MVDDPKRAILGLRSRLQRPSDDPKGRFLEIKSIRHLVVDDPNRAILSLRSCLQHSSDDPKGIFHDMRSIRYLVVDDSKRAILGLRSYLYVSWYDFNWMEASFGSYKNYKIGSYRSLRSRT